MKELYISPEAEVVCFVSEENLALSLNENGVTSFLGWDITDYTDGDWNNWEKWFGNNN